MKKVVLVSAAALLLAACQSDSQRDRTLIGGGLGAATGGGAGAALAGAAIGAVGGGVVGAATTPKNCVATDRYGRRYRVVCP